MITVQKATEIILKNTFQLKISAVPLMEAAGKVLKENLFADRDFPPFDRVTMDGIAISSESFSNGNRKFKIESIGAAGCPQTKLGNPLHCIEIMTGAILPENTDTVVRYEDLKILNDDATIKLEKIGQGQNVAQQGEDRKKGELIIKQGKVISAAEIGVAATIGKAKLKVTSLPKTIIISSGNELVEVTETPQIHQIRKSNVFSTLAVLNQLGIKAELAHLNDDEKVIKKQLTKIINDFDVIIISGGVSMGKFDFIPQVLENLGVEKLFHRVAQRPGKPFWFGVKKAGPVIFAFPGNPVSSFISTLRYFAPWLRASLSLPPFSMQTAILTEDYQFKPDLTLFLQVQISYDDSGKILAKPVPGHGSGNLANLVDADAFLELPQGRELFKKGEAFPVIGFRTF